MLNWCYGAKSPDIEQAVSDAIFAAHRYRNKLCELELAKRERHYELLRRLAPNFVAAESAVADEEKQLCEVRESIQAERVKQRTKSPKGIQRANWLKLTLKELRVLLKDAKLAAYQDPRVIAAMDQNAAQHKAECAEAKAASGLYWGTEAIVKQACGSFASGAPPRFKRYEGEGQLAVQLQGGLDCSDAERYNTLCYIGESIDHRRRKCYIRIGSNGGRPVFACVPIVFHRPLPKGKIKWAYLERRKIADHVRWTIRLTIDEEREPTPAIPGTVAIHTGWRMEPSGLRVATWIGSDGNGGTLMLSESHYNDYLEVDRVRSDRDREFNAIKDRLRDWLKDQSEVPEWMAEAKRYIHQWKSQARLAALWWRWKDERLLLDAEIFDAVGQWRKQDKHRWQHERRLSVRIVRRRKDVFRNFAASIARQYGVAIVSKIAAKELTENSDPESLDRDNTASHRHAKWAAVSELVAMIGEKYCTRCVNVDCKNISQQCSRCGSVASTGKRIRQCSDCGYTEDVDTRAAKNVLARGRVALENGAVLELEQQQRVKAEKAKEKLLKMQAARKAARKVVETNNEN